MEVKIGVLHSPREVAVDSELTPEEVEAQVTAAIADGKGVLSLTDVRGRKVLVPANLISYIEIAQADTRRVGFTAG